MNLVDKAQQQIKEMILNGEYGKDGFLPSEGDLCKILSVSRSTIREAVKSLEIRGFVKRKHGKGIEVVDTTEQTLMRSLSDMFSTTKISLEELLEIRKIVEVPCAGFASSRATDEDLEALLKCVLKLEEFQEVTNKYNTADLEFHQILVESSHNLGLIAISRAYNPILRKLISRATSNEPTQIENICHFHRNIYEAIKNHKEVEAREMVSQHLKATTIFSHL